MEHSVATALASSVLPVPAGWQGKQKQMSSRERLPGVAGLCSAVHYMGHAGLLYSMARSLPTWWAIEQNATAPAQAASKQLGVLQGQLNCTA
jgi:hypothetical protein